MKWWGWGEEAVSFQQKDKPTFAAFVKSAIDIDVSLDPEPVQELAQMEVPPANVPSELISELQRIGRYSVCQAGVFLLMAQTPLEHGGKRSRRAINPSTSPATCGTVLN